MLEAIIENDTISEALETVNVIVEECKIHVNEGGLQIRAVDPANVAMVDVTINAEAFESYEVDEGVLGVNLERLLDVIGMGDSESIVKFNLDEETRKLELTVDNVNYTLALIDPDSIREEPDIPDLDLAAEVVLEASQLERGIKATDMVSDHITLGVDSSEEAFYMEAEGDTDDVDLKLDSDDVIDMSAGDAESLFSLEYLKDIKRAFPKGSTVHTNIGDDFPTKMHLTLQEGMVNVTYMLAPRIQSD